jgi:type I restriction enzyme R subunit
MSVLLDEIIKARKQETLEYAEYLKKIEDLIKKLKTNTSIDPYPKTINTKAKKALYDQFDNNEQLALRVHEKIDTGKQADWKGNRMKEKHVKNVIASVLEEFGITDEAKILQILELAKNQDEY